MDLALVAVMGYVALQLLLGAYVSRRTQNEADYLLAGRRLGFFVATMTVFATWFGSETCIGAAGAIYGEGLSGGRADPFGYGLCILAMGVFFAAMFWRMGLTTIGDYFRRRYGTVAEKAAVLLMVPTSLMWAAAQIRAFGQVLSASSELNVSIAITVAAVVVIAYTAMGGLMADAVTDVLQGGVLLLGILVVAVAVLLGDHGSTSFAEVLSAERLRFRAPGDSIFMSVEAWAIPIAGSLFAQELVARTLAARSADVARYACIAAAGIYLIVGLIPVTLGLIGPALMPNLEDPEQILPLLARETLPTVLYVVFAGALISAILSTVDSTLLACAGLTSHNVLVPMLPGLTEKRKVQLARGLVVAFGVLAYVLALHAEGVYALVEEASAFGSAGIFTAIVLGHAMKNRGGEIAGVASLVAGVATWIWGAYFSENVATPYLLSLAAAAATWIVTAAVTGRVENRLAVEQE